MITVEVFPYVVDLQILFLVSKASIKNVAIICVLPSLLNTSTNFVVESLLPCVSINLYLTLGSSYNKQSAKKCISSSTEPHLQQVLFSIGVLGFNACQLLYANYDLRL